MCLIVDANCRNHLLTFTAKSLGKSLRDQLEKGNVRVATGGKNLDELVKFKSQLAPLFQEWSRSGWLIIYNRKELSDASANLVMQGRLRSNDAHNLALAIVSGAHIILSNNNEFIADFRDPKIVPVRQNCGKIVLHGDQCEARTRQLKSCGCFGT